MTAEPTTSPRHPHAVPPSETPSRGARVLSMLRRAFHAEVRVYSSIGRAIARRPAVPPGGTGVGYHRPVLTVLFIFIVLSAVEIPILDLIVHPWPAVRIPVLILGIWGLTWMVGLPGLAPRGGAHEVTIIRLWADEPRAFLDAARPFLATAD